MRLLLAIAVVVLLQVGAARAAERAIDKETVVDADVDRVWEAWTTRDGIVSFFAPDAEIDARPDGAFHVYFDPYGEPGTKGADTMRYLAIQPKTMLSFDWNAPPSLPAVRRQRTVVIVRFEPRGGQTRVTLHHAGWGDAAGADGKEWDAAYGYFDKAWASVLENLRKRFAPGGRPIDWTAWREQMKKPSAPPKQP